METKAEDFEPPTDLAAARNMPRDRLERAVVEESLHRYRLQQQVAELRKQNATAEIADLKAQTAAQAERIAQLEEDLAEAQAQASVEPTSPQTPKAKGKPK